MSAGADRKTRSPRLSLGSQILVGLVLGIAVGLFFGEYASFLGHVGTAFIRLLQMTVLPYVTVSMIIGMGKLDYHEAAALARKCGAYLLILWGVGVITVLAIPLAFPDWKSASFFSTSLVSEREAIDFIDLYIPTNPFNALANAVVPAVVLFSIAVGVALIGIKKKRTFIEALEPFAEALTRVTMFVVRLTPIGVFAIAASAAGTLSLAQFERLQVYIVIYSVAATLLTFWTLPALVTTLTPLRYRQVVGMTRDALITAFATANLFVVLPVLTERAKEMLAEHSDDETTGSMIDVIIPTSFSFPHTGKIVTLSFILFAAWFAGSALSVDEFPTLIGAGILSLFGSLNMAVPFLLDLHRIPSDMFELFIVTGIINSRFGSMLAAMHTLSIALLGTCAIAGLTRISPRAIARYVIVTGAVTVALFLGVRALFSTVITSKYEAGAIIQRMQLVAPVTNGTVFRTRTDAGPSAGPMGIDGIRERGSLRVGYIADNLPFAFFNEDSTLVGYDVEMAYVLADDIGVPAEFVPVERATFPQDLESGYCDVVMSGVVVLVDRVSEVLFTDAYRSETLAFVVRDHRRNDFNSRAAIQGLEHPVVAAPRLEHFVASLKRYLPHAEIVYIDHLRDFFDAPEAEIDALIFTAERGAAWCLVHPEFAVAVPFPDVVRVPLAYPVARGNRDLADFLNAWISVQERNGRIERLYDRWVLGRGIQQQNPRWSVIRDVLHWVD